MTRRLITAFAARSRPAVEAVVLAYRSGLVTGGSMRTITNLEDAAEIGHRGLTP